MTQLVFSKLAQADVLAAGRWYAERAPRSAALFAVEIDRAVARIAAAPASWPQVSPRLRRCVVRRFPYLLLFRIQSDGSVLVAAVAHQRQSPAFWQQR